MTRLWGTDSRGKVKERIEEVHEAERDPSKPSPFISGDDFFDEFYLDGCEALFVTLGSHRPSAIQNALRVIADDGDVVDALRIVFGESVIVKPSFANLPGRAFRKAFRSVDRTHLVERAKSRLKDRDAARDGGIASDIDDSETPDATAGS